MPKAYASLKKLHQEHTAQLIGKIGARGDTTANLSNQILIEILGCLEDLLAALQAAQASPAAPAQPGEPVAQKRAPRKSPNRS